MSRPRPVLRYHGGKWRLAPWIVAHFPDHRIYVEPYGGAGSVLMYKPQAYAEVYNDLDEDVVNVFRVLRDPAAAARLADLVRLTPWSRREFQAAYEVCTEPIERARRTIVRQFMGFGTTARRASRTGFRAKCYEDRYQTAVTDWGSYPDQVRHFVARLRGVTIECRPALEIIRQQDGPSTLFYVDPPYPTSTRSSLRTKSIKDAYAHDLSDQDHRALAQTLHDVQGYAVVSTYRSDLYDELYAGWWTAATNALADGTRTRRELLYLSPRTSAALTHSLLGLELEARR